MYCEFAFIAHFSILILHICKFERKLYDVLSHEKLRYYNYKKFIN